MVEGGSPTSISTSRGGSSSPVDVLVEERVAKLEEISQRRNALLREMYHLLRRRDDIGNVFVAADDDETHVSDFLERFDLEKHPETGSISTMTDDDFASSLSMPPPLTDTPQEESQRIQAQEVTHSMFLEHDSPMSEPPVSSRISSEPHDDPVVVCQDDDMQDLEYPALASSTPMDIAEDPASSPIADSNFAKQSNPLASPEEHSQAVYPSENAHIDPGFETMDKAIDLGLSEVYPSSLASDDPHVPEKVPSSSSSQQPSQSAFTADDFPESSQANDSFDNDQPTEGQYKRSSIPEEGFSNLTRLRTSPNQDSQATLFLYPAQFDMPIHEQSIAITVMSHLSPMHAPPSFDFTSKDQDVEAPSPVQVATPYRNDFPFTRHYTLPPLKTLPIEFQRKGKIGKQQRKRDKDRERGDKGSEKDGRREGKDDWAPIGINRWGALMRANPIWKKVNRATKCLSTREWGVIFAELRYLRALERVEQMKDQGRWSYRQPKKQRGVGGLLKTHWDHLLEEMKWMRIDFREERKWKMSLACEVSVSVYLWHRAGNREERKKLGIIVEWKKPPLLAPEIYDDDGDDGENEASDGEQMQVDDARPEQGGMLTVDYASDDSDEEQDQDKQDVVDALETSAMINEAIENACRAHSRGEPSQDPPDQVKPKQEEFEDLSALHGDDTPMIVDSQQPQSTAIDKEANTAEGSEVSGLKSSSKDPVLPSGLQPQLPPVTIHHTVSSTKSHSKSGMYAPFRSQIAYLDDHALFLSMDDLHLGKNLPEVSENSTLDEMPPPADLSAIFPDLQPYGLLDVGPAAEGRKKSEKRDRDDPHKRAEDITYSKLTPVTKYMRIKPTLLGPLQPSKHWKNDQWTNFDEGPVVPDVEIPLPSILWGITCSLFEGSKPISTSVNDDSPIPGTPQDAPKRVADLYWSTQDDLLLKRLVEKYPRNWGLIADSFNSSRAAISTEKRLDWECKERYYVRWLGGDRVDAGSAVPEGPPMVTPVRPQPQMTTRKRLASVTTAATSAASVPAPSNEAKKRRRHALMYDTIRKAIKKKESNIQKNNANTRKSTAIHDTHGQYNKMPKMSPAELSRMKAEKEGQEMARRKQHEEAMRQQAALQHAQRMGVQNLQAQQQQPNGTPRSANGVQHQVPQIRSQVNISQQQRLPVQMPGAANTRIPSQQLLHAQAQQRALAAAASANLAAGAMNAAHLSPPYASRAASASPAVPQLSPPRSSATPNPTRPPSAQQRPGHQASPNMQQQVTARPAANIAQFYPQMSNIHNPQFSTEQMEQALRLQSLMVRNGIVDAQRGVTQ